MLKHFSYGCSINNFTKAVFLIISCLSNNPIIATSLNSEEKIIVENFLEGFINCFDNVSEAQLAQELSNVQTGIPGHKIKDPEKRAWKIKEEIKKITRQNNGSNFKKIILILNTIYNYLGDTEGISDLQFADHEAKKIALEKVFNQMCSRAPALYDDNPKRKAVIKWLNNVCSVVINFTGADDSIFIILDRTGFGACFNNSVEEKILNSDLDIPTTTSIQALISKLRNNIGLGNHINIEQEDLSFFGRQWASFSKAEVECINGWLELVCKETSDYISSINLKDFIEIHLSEGSLLINGLARFNAEARLKKIKSQVPTVLKSKNDPALKLLEGFGLLQKIIGGVSGSKISSTEIEFVSELHRLKAYIKFIDGGSNKPRFVREIYENENLASILKLFASRFYPLLFCPLCGKCTKEYENILNSALGKIVTNNDKNLIVEGSYVFSGAAVCLLKILRKIRPCEPFSGYETAGRSVQEIIDYENQNLQQIAPAQPRQPQPYSLPAKSEKFDMYAKITDNSSQSRIRDSSSSYSYNNNANSQSRSQRSDASQGQSYSNGGSSSQCRPAANNLRYLQESLDFLGITKAIHDVSEDDVKFAFRIKAMKYHPDKNDSDEAKVYFQEFSNAKEEVLSHIKNRN